MRKLAGVLWLVLCSCLVALSLRVAAQSQKTDRQLLTEALATITAVRDRMPADPVPIPDPPPVPDPTPTPIPTGRLLFTSGWESGLGCGPALLDAGAWADYGGSGACSGSVHDADVVADVAKLGAHSLRITQKPGGVNGTDFREIRTFGNQSEVTLIAWLRYHSAWHWANADHKIFLFMDASGNQPNVYINQRGGSDPKHARLCMYPTANDTFFCASNPQMTVGIWYRLRVHVVAGAHGKVEMWLQPDGQAETALVLTRDAGNGATSPNDVNAGAIGGLKLDTTYNDGGSVTAAMYMWYDGIAVSSGLVP